MTTQSQIKQKSNGNLLGFFKQRKAMPRLGNFKKPRELKPNSKIRRKR